jgi:muconolactone delta-isomerase
MYNADTHRLELAMSSGNARVDRLQSEVAELRSQLIKSQGEIRALRWEVVGQYVPWSVLMHVLDGCGVVIPATRSGC